MSVTAGVLLALGLLGHPVDQAVSWSESRMAASGPLSAVTAIVVKMNPRRLEFRLETATLDYGLRADWSIDRIPANGIAAFNAGQFIGGFPWGWRRASSARNREPRHVLRR